MKALISTSIITASLLCLSTATIAEEQDGNQNNKRRGPPAFSVVDVNNDGLLELGEFEQHTLPRGDHARLFARIDADQNGQITEEEWTNHKPKRQKKPKNDS